MTRSHWGFVAGMLLLGSVIAVFWREAHQPWQAWQAQYNAQPGATPVPIAVRALVPTSTGKPELCVSCHVGIEDISAAHPAEALGCVVCHGGEPLALDANRAHATLRGGRNPSDLGVAAQSCGQPACHGGYAGTDAERNHVARVINSLQATYAGGIATVRYALGAQTSPTATLGVHAAADTSATLPARAVRSLDDFLAHANGQPSDAKFAAGCLAGGCHLWTAPAAQPYFYRSTGCAACHYAYNDDGLYRGRDPTIPRDQPGHGAAHRLSTAIEFTQCNHCHNRGNYSLKQMAFLPRDDLPPLGAAIPTTMPPEGRRLKEYYQPIAEFTRCEYELNCVDCHTAQEAMGDNHLYGSKKDAQYVQCQTCHGTPTTLPALVTITDPNEVALRQARLNDHADYIAVGDQVVVTERGERLWSIKKTAAGLTQLDKVSGQIYNVPSVMASRCTQDGATQTSDYCHTCHAVAR